MYKGDKAIAQSIEVYRAEYLKNEISIEVYLDKIFQELMSSDTVGYVEELGKEKEILH